MDSSFKFRWLLALLLVVITHAFCKPLEDNTGVDAQEEMMDMAESQNPFLPRFAMKILKERREKARAQRLTMNKAILIIGVFGFYANASTTTEAEVNVIFENNNPVTDTISLFNSENEQKNDEATLNNESDEPETNFDANINIVIEEDLEIPVNQFLPQETKGNLPVDDYYRNDVIERNADEIMDTAAGFVPIPIIRRQKPKRRFATRRYFRRNPYPYRRYQFYSPYYGFYRPSSLRYYY
ncbi:unnamed protein product [Leptidea sinapis]|uniref:Uncharacterized protein n=1 Tax=Leptidea sinapis TaxID=189913 RepID=A0A5E4Q4L0_9NEOP|nr:unnamed protein product [Leptidea sinapis]